MSNMIISTNPDELLSVEGMGTTLNESPSVTTFLPEEDASTCPLLSSTPSPPCMDFIHPLTPSTGNDGDNTETAVIDDGQAETSSSGSSSGINMEVSDTNGSNLFNKNIYHHLNKNGDLDLQNGSGLQMKNGGGYSKTSTPGFVKWNWPTIRKCSMGVFIAALLGMCGIVVAHIYTLPTSCNPKVEWYKGGVFYEIFPASFKDTNNDGMGDLKGIAAQIDYLTNLGISAVRLNPIFPSTSYPENYHNVTTLLEIDPVLGNKTDFAIMARVLHMNNISVIIDFPIYPLYKELHVPQLFPSQSSNETDGNDEPNYLLYVRTESMEDNPITKAIQMWTKLGVDGFYIKGLENFGNDPYYLESIMEWKLTLGRDRMLMISKKAFDLIEPSEVSTMKQYINLVDVYLDVSKGTEFISQQIKSILNNTDISIEDGHSPWVHWNLGGLNERRLTSGLTTNVTLAATIMQLMLPGTPSIFYGDEISLQEVHDPFGDHLDTKHIHHLPTMSFQTGPKFTAPATMPWLPRGASASFDHFDYVANMIALRSVSPSIYKNSYIKKNEQIPELNTAVRYNVEKILILERWYSRRNTFISISNFSDKKITMDLSSIYYSGIIMLGTATGNEILFSDFVIGPMETLIVKLHK